MTKYVIEKTNNYSDHWNYCTKNSVLFIRIIPANKYAKVEYDIYPMLGLCQLTKYPMDFMNKLYEVYIEFFKLPKEKVSCTGGSNNLIFTVYKEHSDFFANQLYDYLNDFVVKNSRAL